MSSDCRLIFIGGSPRSGTTLLQNILDSHPLILGGPEFLHLPDIIELRRRVNGSIDKEFIDIFCTKGEVDIHIKSIVENLFLPLANKNNCQFYSEKTPQNILVFLELIELFPEAHFIQIIRDPRAVISSLLQVRKRAIEKSINSPHYTANLRASIAYLKQCPAAGSLAEKHHPRKVLTVIYEDLVKNPQQETKRICAHIGIDWHENMLRPEEKDHMGQQAITVKSGEIWYDKTMYKKGITKENSSKWQKKLTIGQQIRIVLSFKDLSGVTAHSYDFSLNSLSKTNPVLLKTYYSYLATISKIVDLIQKLPGNSLFKRVLLKIVNIL